MRTITLLVGFVIVIQCKPQTPPFGVLNVSVQEAKELIAQNPNLVIIDVRTPEETDEGTIENAQVVDVRNDNFQEEISKLDMEEMYLVYCRSGKRSTEAVGQMSEMGFNRIYNMEGGYLGWLDDQE